MQWMATSNRSDPAAHCQANHFGNFVESGFVIIPGPTSGDLFNELTAAYGEVMALASGPDFKIASATTRMSDVLSYGYVMITSISIHLSLRLAVTSSKSLSNSGRFWP
jgi:hypothetical protein